MVFQAIIWQVVDCCRTISGVFGLANILIASLLYWFIGTMWFSSSASSFRIVLPSLKNIGSLFKDPSLVPPFRAPSEINDGDERTEGESTSPLSNDDVYAIVPGADTTHFCFLMHGLGGLSSDLTYLEATLNQQAFCERSNRFQEADDDDFVIIPETVPSEDNGENSNQRGKPHDFVVHNIVCNEWKTNDGVINGGERMIDEIRQTIETEMKRRHPQIELKVSNEDNCVSEEGSEKKLYDITLSVVGNSMGGLYGRYAVAKLIDRHCQVCASVTKNESDSQETQHESSQTWILDGKYKIRLNVFCTTASPHLGVSKHTWVRLPRIAELGIARTFGQSGKDLFRMNDLLYDMATNPIYLKPLGSFRKRIAYANGYGTDFYVPVKTAAFLSEYSSFPHHQACTNESQNRSGLFVASLQTSLTEEYSAQNEEFVDEFHEMSVSLDKLGWEKVFIDLRKEMSRLELPKPFWKKTRSRSQQDTSDANDAGLVNIPNLADTRVISSKDIISLVHSGDCDHDGLTLHAPSGHNMIVAFSRGRFATFLNRGGRPVVDELAKELSKEMFLCTDC